MFTPFVHYHLGSGVHVLLFVLGSGDDIVLIARVGSGEASSAEFGWGLRRSSRTVRGIQDAVGIYSPCRLVPRDEVLIHC